MGTYVLLDNPVWVPANQRVANLNKFSTTVLCFAACLQTITLLGPMFGFLLGSYCAKLYVDIGYVDMGKCDASVLEKNVTTAAIDSPYFSGQNHQSPDGNV